MLFADWLRVKKNKLRRAGTHVLRAMKRRHPRIIVSMTSYPARINTVHLAIRSLLAQKVLPDKIVLWLCKSDFPNRETDLPQTLRDVLWHDVEIRWVNEDLKPHNTILSGNTFCASNERIARCTVLMRAGYEVMETIIRG